MNIKNASMIFIPLFSSCLIETDCSKINDSTKKEKYSLVIEGFKKNGRDLKFLGYDPNTKIKTSEVTSEGSYYGNFDAFDIGDTLNKDSGELFYLIKKRNLNIKINLDCNKPNTRDSLKKE